MKDRLLSNSGPSAVPIMLSPRRKGKTEKDSKTSISEGEKAGEKMGKLVKGKDNESESASKEKVMLGTFQHLPYYVSLYESLKGSYGNYKVSGLISYQCLLNFVFCLYHSGPISCLY